MTVLGGRAAIVMQLRSLTQLGCIHHAVRVPGCDSLSDFMPSSPDLVSPVALGLTIIGTGPVAHALGLLFARSGRLVPQTVLGRSSDSAARLAAILADATPHTPRVFDHIEQLEQLEQLDAVVMIATPDCAIRETSDALASSNLVGPGQVVFHCSGALDHEQLAACAKRGASIASAHPLASFADPERLIASFAGVYCATEGESVALDVIEPCFTDIGARVVRLSGGLKTAYHAGAVLASGYLQATIAAALAAEKIAGIESEQARDMLAPLIRMSVENALRGNSIVAMSGPLVRGDDAVVKAHYATLIARDPALADCYAALTRYASKLLERADPLEGAT